MDSNKQLDRSLIQISEINIYLWCWLTSVALQVKVVCTAVHIK